jgi:hypothetical protein
MSPSSLPILDVEEPDQADVLNRLERKLRDSPLPLLLPLLLLLLMLLLLPSLLLALLLLLLSTSALRRLAAGSSGAPLLEALLDISFLDANASTHGLCADLRCALTLHPNVLSTACRMVAVLM